MSDLWRVDTPAESHTCATRAEADALEVVLRSRGARHVVTWAQGEPVGGDGAEAVVIAPVSDSSGSVGSKVIRALRGRNGTIQEESA